MEETTYKAGFVSIVGDPNAGKSSLTNRLVGARLAIVTPKAHTTRYEQVGIFTTKDFQLCLVDTPGWVSGKTALQQHMNESIQRSLRAPDLIIWLVDGAKSPTSALPEEALSRIKILQKNCPVQVVVNKIDTFTEEALSDYVTTCTERVGETVQGISALKQTGLAALIATMVSHLPVHLPYFPATDLTNKNSRFIAAEIIRKHVLLQYRQEIPYHTHVEVERFSEEKLLEIDAILYVSRPSQQAIILGTGGRKIKRLGRSSRQELERFFNQRVYLKLWVKVDKSWLGAADKHIGHG